MVWMRGSSDSLQLGDENTGEPHLYRSGSLSARHYLPRLERDPRELHLRTAIAVHLPRVALAACGVAAIIFGSVVLEKAEGMTAAGAERDLQAICATTDRLSRAVR